MKLEVLSGERRGDSFTVMQDVVRVGAAAESDLVLQDQEVSREHAELRKRGDSWFVIDLGSLNGTMVNGRPVHGRKEVFDRDRIELGPVEIRVCGARRGVTSPMTTRRRIGSFSGAAPCLQMVGGGSDARYALNRERMTVGRNADNDIVIPETTVSACHAALECSGGAVTLIDDGSTNGTFVNGERVETRKLEDGDHVAFDQFQFVFQAGGSAPRRTARRSTCEEMNGGGAGCGPATRKSADSGDKEEGEIDGAAPVRPSPRREKKRTTLAVHIASAAVVVLSMIAVGLMIRGQAASGDSMQASLQVGMPVNPVPEVLQAAVPVASEIEQPEGAPEAAAVIIDSRPEYVKNPAAAMDDGATLDVEKIQYSQLIERVFFGLTRKHQLPGGIEGAAVLGDLTGDGKPDFLVASTTGCVAAFDGKSGESLFSTYLGRSFVSEPVLSDLDGDGISEAIIASRDGEVFAIYHTGQILWQSRDETGGHTIAGGVAVAELTGDRTPDVVICDEPGTVHVLNGRTGFLERKGERLRGPVLGSPIIGPTASDGHPSIIVAAGSGMVYRLFGGELNKMWEHDTGAPIMTTPQLLDFNQDGIDDVMVACSDARGTIRILDGRNGRRIWEYQIGSPHSASPLLVEGESENMLLLCCTWRGVAALDLTEKAPVWVFDNPSDLPIRACPVVHDFNADGEDDVLVSVAGVGLIVIDGREGGELLRFPIGGEVVARAAIGDVDGDRNVDVVVTDRDGSVTVITTNRHVPEGPIVG